MASCPGAWEGVFRLQDNGDTFSRSPGGPSVKTAPSCGGRGVLECARNLGWDPRALGMPELPHSHPEVVAGAGAGAVQGYLVCGPVVPFSPTRPSPSPSLTWSCPRWRFPSPDPSPLWSRSQSQTPLSAGREQGWDGGWQWGGTAPLPAVPPNPAVPKSQHPKSQQVTKGPVSASGCSSPGHSPVIPAPPSPQRRPRLLSSLPPIRGPLPSSSSPLPASSAEPGPPASFRG